MLNQTPMVQLDLHSIMVQLLSYAIELFFYYGTNLHSIMVQLLLKYLVSKPSICGLFTFHYGSITI